VPPDWNDELEGSDKLLFDLVIEKLKQPSTPSNMTNYETTVLDEMWSKWIQVLLLFNIEN
jgi:hypothetical protein